MKIYTSYWAQVRNWPRNLVGLNSTMWPPKWRPLGKDKRGVIVVDCPPLKPGKECEGLCRGPEMCSNYNPNNCAFLQAYYKQLCNFNFNDFLHSLEKLKFKICQDEQLDDVDFALLVYEPLYKKCSERQKLQIWLQENGVEVEEWQKVKS